LANFSLALSLDQAVIFPSESITEEKYSILIISSKVQAIGSTRSSK